MEPNIDYSPRVEGSYFNPVAGIKKGVDPNLVKRVWCAENVQMAITAFEQGLPLIATPFLTGHVELRRPGLNYVS